MRNNIILIISIFFLSTICLQAQDFDNEPKLSADIDDVNIKVGGRLISDVAYYKTDFTPLNSGAAITDARIRAALTYNDWYFYADFAFGKGEFAQKNIFMKYTLPFSSEQGIQSLKAGYFAEPNSMSRLTSIYSMHFISRSTAANALGIGRSLGLTYNFFNPAMTLTQGVFAENKYNDQLSGFQGASVGGRWVYRPLHTDGQILHIGVSARFAQLNTGEMVDDIKQAKLHLSSSLETYVDDTDSFLNAELPWAKNIVNLGAEALYMNPKMFLRGEYFYKHISKKRPDELLFTNQLGGVWSWTTLESWQAGNPLKSNHFQGFYIEGGYKIFGGAYQYSYEEALLKGNNTQSLEVVARFSHTNLNQINKGDIFVEGRDQFYPNGEVTDYPPASTSVGGGKMNSATIGVNYTFNQFAQVMFDYTYSRLDNVYFSNDKNFHTLQGRVMFNF